MMAAVVRLATSDDLSALCTIDSLACREARRRDRIRRGVEDGEIRVAEVNGRIVGYALMSYSFFERPFIELVMIEAAYRGSGFGPMLIRSLEADCVDERLFTSTNASNAHMRHVLEKLGYESSGIIHHLDPGDPELVYSKALSGSLT